MLVSLCQSSRTRLAAQGFRSFSASQCTQAKQKTEQSFSGTVREQSQKFRPQRLNRNLAGTVVFLSGAGAKTSLVPALMAAEAGAQVIGFTGSEPKETGHPRLHFVGVDRKQLKDPSYLSQRMRDSLDALDVPLPDHLVFLNLIGSSTPNGSSSLDDLNIHIPLSFAKATQEVGKERAGMTSVGNISSIAIEVLDSRHSYAVSRRTADEEMMRLSINGNVIIARPGMVLPDLTPEGRLAMGHAYSPGEVRMIDFVLGDGLQPHNPISAGDLYEGVLSGLTSETPQRLIVSANGSEVVSQKQMFRHLNPNGKMAVNIPYPVARTAALEWPFGRLAPYAVDLHEVLEGDSDKRAIVESREFEEILLERPAQGFHEVYPKERTIVGSRNWSVMKHMGVIVPSLVYPTKSFGFGKLMISAMDLRRWGFEIYD